MTVTYFKRYKMEIELVQARPVPPLPPGYEFVPWHDSLCEMHAQVKFHCFHDEIDAIVFPSLSQRDGCYYLMQEIRQRAGFIPANDERQRGACDTRPLRLQQLGEAGLKGIVPGQVHARAQICR